MNHKRHRPKNRRAGCLMCKPWKVNGAKANGRDLRRPASEVRQAVEGTTRELEEAAERDSLHPAELRWGHERTLE